MKRSLLAALAAATPAQAAIFVFEETPLLTGGYRFNFFQHGLHHVTIKSFDLTPVVDDSQLSSYDRFHFLACRQDHMKLE